MVGESEETSGSRGRELLAAEEMVAAEDGSETVESITSLGDSKAIAGDDDERGAEDGSTCWCGTDDSVAWIVERDDGVTGSEDDGCWVSNFG